MKMPTSSIPTTLLLTHSPGVSLSVSWIVLDMICSPMMDIPEYSLLLVIKIRFLQTGLVFTGEASFLQRQIVRLLR